jgi:L-threonylcarbamoyladenylate synthase
MERDTSIPVVTRMVGADEAGVAEAARVLASGGLVAFPTETVYGLGADATSAGAVARLYAAKGRPRFNPLIVHVATPAAARALAAFNADAEKLAQAFWPGPLTLVLPKAPACPVAELATAGLNSVAVRIPASPVALRLLAACGRPVAAPSANRSGHVSPTTAAHVRADLDGVIDLIVDGGPTDVGIESTIVACLDAPMLLRPGGLAREDIASLLGRPLVEPKGGAASAEDVPLAPGQLSSHYAPRSPVRLDAESVTPGEALLAFGPSLPRGAAQAIKTLNLSSGGDLVEAAANLFSFLRALDAAGAARIAIMPIPHHGLGEAINDRLLRAASPR